MKGIRSVLSLLTAVILLCACGAAGGEETVIPEIRTESFEVPDNEALRLIREMKAGWNLGNTFDAYDCFWVKDPLDYESAWCGAKTTRELIRALKDAGFRTVRVPVSWHNHLAEDWTVDPAWMARVHEVVSWVLEEGMYAIVNIHHDCDPRYYYPDAAHAESAERYVRTIWRQVASPSTSRG